VAKPVNKEEATMLNTKSLFAFALLVALLGAAIPAEAQKKAAPTKDQSAARAACFEKAQAAATGATTAEKNANGSMVYHECARKAGIRP
jgi:hypothetical protein